MRPALIRLAAVFLLSATPAFGQDVSELARRLLDDALPSADREAIVKDHPARSAALIAALTRDLAVGTPEEYRRIPWIWRVAIAAGKRNEADELIKVLEVSLPAPNAPLDDWRAVVIGGGIINGISLTGPWPKPRIESILRDRPGLLARWKRALDLAAEMADDLNVKTGTRYDALRMLGVESWDKRGAQLFRYLLKDVHPELQQGAIGGLADVDSPAASQALLSGIGHYSAYNKNFVLDALMRDESRIAALLDAVESKRTTAAELGPDRIARLMSLANPALKDRAARLLAK